MSEVASALGVRQSALNNPPVVMYYWGDDPATTNLFITDNHPNFKKVFKKLKRAHGKPSFLYVSRENPRKKGKGRRRVAVLMPVPTRIKKTPRSAAEWLYVYPKQEKFPIGDLFHARLAMIYVMSRTNAKARNDVFGAVVKEYPRYDWAMYWEEKTQERKAKKTKAKRKKSRRAAANPKKKPNYGLKLGKAYYDQLPTNAGPYLPDIFPYGQGGRPATYHRK